jgi:hypothetical protein
MGLDYGYYTHVTNFLLLAFSSRVSVRFLITFFFHVDDDTKMVEMSLLVLFFLQYPSVPSDREKVST